MSNLTKENYALAAYCFIHAMLQAPKPELKHDADTLLADLEHHFRNKNGIDDKYRFLCEKAMMLGIFGGTSSKLKGKICDTLLSNTLGLPVFGISGQQVLSFKRKNPSLFTPLEIVTKGLLKYLAHPSEEAIETCTQALTRLDKQDWMEYFFQALTYDPTQTHSAHDTEQIIYYHNESTSQPIN